MHQPNLPLTRDLVLVGGGHTHALVLRKWGMFPLPGARLTVINPGPTAPYSGMLPGFVAGHYDRDDLDIDLVKLARFAGARVILGAVTGLNPETRQITVDGRPPVGYDVASVNVGITSAMPDLPGFADHGIPAKPLGAFAARWQVYLAGDDPAQVAVIGGGVAGAELAMAMAFALDAKGRKARVSLIDSAQALTAVGSKASAKLHAAIDGLGIELLENATIKAIHADHIELDDGRVVPSQFTTGAAGARAYDWQADTGLDTHDGFLSVDACLRTSNPTVFAAGDCAHLTDDPRPKAGVYAVREAPVLFDNLCATMSGMKLRPYKPQKDYLKLISLGGKSALGERSNLTFAGPWVWRWKNHIDQGFMTRFRDLPAMAHPDLPPIHATGMDEVLGDKPMCGGCGAKVGRDALRAALAPLPAPIRDDITALPGDDAALLTVGGKHQVLTSDHLRALTEDPVLMTRIAAVHALGDIWAMGATPQAATATLILPRMSATLQQRTLAEIMATATKVMRAAGAEIVGGHSSMGDELTIGFSITGLCDGDPITLSGARAGDALILTKPLGSGTLMAGDMALAARGADVAAALTHMTRPQSGAAGILRGAHAMTDVTGFGLAGHLAGICEESGVAAQLDLQAIPLMDGAWDLSHAGVRSTLFDDNRALAPNLPRGDRADLLFDPQTAGGLLAAVAADQADKLVDQLRAQGDPAVIIGWMTDGPPQITLTTG